MNSLNRVLWKEEACNGYYGLQNKKSKIIDTKGDLSKNSKTQSENKQNDGIESELNKLCLNNVNNIFVDHLNISSLPGKSDQLELLITNKIDILVLNETKLGGNLL